MSKTVIVWTCSHSEPAVSNKRFKWLGKLIGDVKPDYCVDLGDGADMRSLNTFDSARPSRINSQSYEKDINVYNDSQDQIRYYGYRKNKKKKIPIFGFEGNHEHRIKRAIDHDPRLEGTNYGISFGHLNTDEWFDEYHEYYAGAPAIHNYDGVDYAHFVGSGNYGNAISGEHHAHSLLKKRLNSTTVGHSHKRNIYFRDDAKAIGLVAGCFKGADEDWAGQANKEWAAGVVIKRNLSEGMYDLEWVSLAALEKAYG